MNCSPCSNRLNASGQSGSSHSINARFEQLPLRTQMSGTGRSLSLEGFRDEIFVLIHNDRILIAGVLPNRFIRRSLQTELENMCRLMTFPRDPLCKRRWKLSVNQKLHVGCKTAWSAWRAAYASAALISSGSRYGKSRRISSCETPSASMPRMSATRIRRPRTHGRPPHLSGSTVMRSNNSIASEYFSKTGATSECVALLRTKS
jgi:hypothetical protein